MTGDGVVNGEAADDRTMDRGRVEGEVVSQAPTGEESVGGESVDQDPVDRGAPGEGEAEKFPADEERADEEWAGEARADEVAVHRGTVQKGAADEGVIDEAVIDEGMVDKRTVAAPRRGRSDNTAAQVRGVLLPVGAMVLLVLLVRFLLPPSAEESTAAPTAPPVATVAPLASGPLQVVRTLTQRVKALGSSAALDHPQEAVQLPDGDIAVADTGKRRVLILDSRGGVRRSITTGAGRLIEPYALAVSGHVLYVLDSERRAIERYALDGRFEAEVFRGRALAHPRGMAVGPNHDLYVADPGANAVFVISPDGRIVQRFQTPVDTGPDSFNQPSDVSVAANGTIYVLDNNNQRVRALDSSGRTVGLWPAPPSSTLFSVHVLAMSSGRLLLSDPSGSLLLYRRGTHAAVRTALRTGGSQAQDISPLGLALTRTGKVLVTDNTGNRILVASLPR
jgi:hypothetical protein